MKEKSSVKTVNPTTNQSTSKKWLGSVDSSKAELKEHLAKTTQSLEKIQGTWEDMKLWIPALSNLTDTEILEDHPLSQLKDEGILFLAKSRRQIEQIQKAQEEVKDRKKLSELHQSLLSIEKQANLLFTRYQKLLAKLPIQSLYQKGIDTLEKTVTDTLAALQPLENQESHPEYSVKSVYIKSLVDYQSVLNKAKHTQEISDEKFLSWFCGVLRNYEKANQMAQQNLLKIHQTFEEQLLILNEQSCKKGFEGDGTLNTLMTACKNHLQDIKFALDTLKTQAPFLDEKIKTQPSRNPFDDEIGESSTSIATLESVFTLFQTYSHLVNQYQNQQHQLQEKIKEDFKHSPHSPAQLIQQLNDALEAKLDWLAYSSYSQAGKQFSNQLMACLEELHRLNAIEPQALTRADHISLKMANHQVQGLQCLIREKGLEKLSDDFRGRCQALESLTPLQDKYHRLKGDLERLRLPFDQKLDLLGQQMAWVEDKIKEAHAQGRASSQWQNKKTELLEARDEIEIALNARGLATSRKINAIEACFQAIAHGSIEEINDAVCQLKLSPHIDVNRGLGFQKVTDTRKVVDPFVREMEALLTNPLLWVKALRSDQTDFMDQKAAIESELIKPLLDQLLQKKSWLNTQRIPPQWEEAYNVLLSEINPLLDTKDSMLLDGKGKAWMDQCELLLQSIQAFEQKITHLPKAIEIKENPQTLPPKEENFQSQVQVKVDKHFHAPKLQKKSTLTQLKEEIKSEVGEFFDKVAETFSPNKKSIRKVQSKNHFDDFEKELKGLGLFQEEINHLVAHYEEIYESVENLIYSQDKRYPGFLKHAKTCNEEFYARQCQLAGSTVEENQLFKQYEKVEAFINDAFELKEKHPDQVKSLIHAAMLARVQFLQEQGERGGINIETMQSSRFYSSFFFTHPLEEDGKSLKSVMLEAKVASKDPKNSFKFLFWKAKIPSLPELGINFLNKDLASYFVLRNPGLFMDDGDEKQKSVSLFDNKR
jgi:hypothetical protein